MKSGPQCEFPNLLMTPWSLALCPLGIWWEELLWWVLSCLWGALDHMWGLTNVFPSSLIIHTPGAFSLPQVFSFFQYKQSEGFPNFQLVSSLMNRSDWSHFFLLEFYYKYSENSNRNKQNHRPGHSFSTSSGISSATFFSDKLYLPTAHEDVNTVWPSSLSLYDKAFSPVCSRVFAIMCFPFPTDVSAEVSTETSIIGLFFLKPTFSSAYFQKSEAFPDLLFLSLHTDVFKGLFIVMVTFLEHTIHVPTITKCHF